MLATGDDLNARLARFFYVWRNLSVLSVALRDPHWQENRPVVHAVEIDAGFENVEVAGQSECHWPLLMSLL